MTNASLLLLGKPEAVHYLSPASARISWILRDKNNIDLDYQHFDCPLILSTDKVLAKIRNLTIRHLPDGTLFPSEITQYDSWVIREMLHNCIAHQDYTLSGKINLVELPDALIFSNMGSFIPGSVEDMIRSDAPPSVYRNAFLSQAMVSLNMIDTIGSGIKRTYQKQKERSFPMPDYQLEKKDCVEVRVSGKIIDDNYTRILLSNLELSLFDAIALDRIQKRIPINEVDFKRLKSLKLIEGRRPSLFVSAKVAALTGDKASYIKNLAFDKSHYKQMVISFLEKYGKADRPELDKLLLDKISDALDSKQRKVFVTNLLQEMRRDEQIEVDGTTRGAFWRLDNFVQKNSV